MRSTQAVVSFCEKDCCQHVDSGLVLSYAYLHVVHVLNNLRLIFVFIEQVALPVRLFGGAVYLDED